MYVNFKQLMILIMMQVSILVFPYLIFISVDSFIERETCLSSTQEEWTGLVCSWKCSIQNVPDVPYIAC